MRRNICMVVITALLLAGAGARAAMVTNITGMLQNPEAALDTSTDTAAVLARPEGREYFEFIIHLDEEAPPDIVSIYLSPAPEDVFLESSADIVNWTPRSVVIKRFEEPEMYSVELDVTDAAPAQYLRIRIVGEAEQFSLFDVGVEFSQEEANSILSLKVEPMDDNAVAVVYTTEHPAYTNVSYGPEGPVMTNVYIDRLKATDHRAELKGLLPGTKYFYQVRLADTDETAEIQSFTTPGSPPPYIRRIDIPVDPGPNSAELLLGANKAVKWKVVWGVYSEDISEENPESAEVAMVKESGELQKKYKVNFDGLAPKTRYFFKVYVEDEDGEKSDSKLLGFDTAELNLALGASVTGTFTHELDDKYIKQTDTPMARVTDGDENYVTGFAKSEKPAYTDQWIEVDLGKNSVAERLVIVWSDLAVPKKYTVTARTEEGESVELLSVENEEYPETATVRNRRSLPGGDPLFQVTLQTGGAEYRYIKVLIPKGAEIRSRFGWKYAILAEVKAIAP